MTTSEPFHFATTGWSLIAALKPQPRTEPDMTTKPDMYEAAYWRVSAVLDRVLGTEESDGGGEGIAADVALLAQRYTDLKRAVLSDRSVDWARTIAEIEARDLRDEVEAA
jgi:hypothetical protein